MKEWNTGLMAHLGMRFVEVGPDRVVAELDVRAELATVGGALHGGTLMALADTVGAAGTAAMGLRTATLESKTNFFAAALQGRSAPSPWRCTRASAPTCGRRGSPTKAAGSSRSPSRPR